MKLQYKVRVKYYDFIFEDAQEAISFAITAKLHQAESRDDDFHVHIDFISIEDDVAEDSEDNGEASAGAAMLREDY